MSSYKKYLSVLAAFIVGVTGAVGYVVHAQNVTSSVPSTNTQVQTSVQDPKQLDGEVADDSKSSVNATSNQQEAESGPADSGTDTNEAD